MIFVYTIDSKLIENITLDKSMLSQNPISGQYSYVKFSNQDIWASGRSEMSGGMTRHFLKSSIHGRA